MEHRKFEKPLAVEELIMRIRPDLLDRWMELDHEIWTKGLAEWPGFAGKELWLSGNVPGEVTIIVYWTDLDLWKAIDAEWLERMDRQVFDILGEENIEYVEARHCANQKYKVAEFR